ncbi:Transposon Ty3-I Gag-Pol polyprotein [Senna tora]|uniref:Transposon Ty3-I Gag-Pol polyprotein n=1 Tax=Senna tora TaxID=362788 RepID=A0A834SP62_9FABA|nr:Transposon Ty3-I Gag-Pol polyprotein [Senna tora]
MREQTNATTKILRHMQEERDHRPPARPNEADTCRGWVEFQNARPSTFRGEFNPVLAEGWLKELEKIFKVLKCTEEQKVEFAIYMLAGEAEHWWRGAQQLMEARDVQLTWDTFKTAFLEKYYPMSVRNQKEIEFMQLKQGNMPFEEFIAKYEELSKFSSYLKLYADEARKAMHMSGALNSAMKNVVAPLAIKNYAELVDRCRIVALNIEGAEKYKQKVSSNNKRPMNFSKDGNNKGKKPMLGFKIGFAVSSLIFSSENVLPFSVTLLPGLLEVVVSSDLLEENVKFQNREDVVACYFEKNENKTLLECIT